MAIHIGAVGYVETSAMQLKSSLGNLANYIDFVLHVGAAHHLKVLPSLIHPVRKQGEKRCDLQ